MPRRRDRAWAVGPWVAGYQSARTGHHDLADCGVYAARTTWSPKGGCRQDGDSRAMVRTRSFGPCRKRFAPRDRRIVARMRVEDAGSPFGTSAFRRRNYIIAAAKDRARSCSCFVVTLPAFFNV